MKCAWKELLGILPGWIARETDKLAKDNLQEIRMRLCKTPEMVTADGSRWLERPVCRDDLNFCINTASRYSPWSANTIASGYLTALGGHRIGICGTAVVKDGCLQGIRDVDSLCIRVARDIPGIGHQAAQLKGSILLMGPPGSGKTTLLRDLARQISYRETVAIVDEREELFPRSFERGRSLDVLSGCSKDQGIDMVLRTMGPATIGVDEITAERDCDALIRAGWCGVRLLATAHAASMADLRSRPVYRSLIAAGLFDHVLVLGRDKSWHRERMDK